MLCKERRRHAHHVDPFAHPHRLSNDHRHGAAVTAPERIEAAVDAWLATTTSPVAKAHPRDAIRALVEELDAGLTPITAADKAALAVLREEQTLPEWPGGIGPGSAGARYVRKGTRKHDPQGGCRR